MMNEARRRSQYSRTSLRFVSLLPQMKQNPRTSTGGAEDSRHGTRRGGRVGTSEEQRQPRIPGFEDQANSDLATIQGHSQRLRSITNGPGHLRWPSRLRV